MATKQQSKLSTSGSDKDIDALLKRLHSGCRFIVFEDSNKINDVSNLYRNATQPDEVHSELGRALAHSFIHSLNEDVGERIILALCCGDDAESDEDQRFDKSNYASVAHSFFAGLAEFIQTNNEEEGNKIRSMWQKWTARCEELVYPADELSPTNNRDGHSVLLACLTNYSSIYFDKVSTCDSDMVYKSLKCSTSRKYWIRSVANALESANATVGGRPEEANALFHNFHLLFESCILQARSTIQLSDQVAYNEERGLILTETLRICSMNLFDDPSVSQFTIEMIQYLATSLDSFLDQLIYTSTENNEYSILLEFSYEWLRGLSDLIRTVSTKNLQQQNIKSLTFTIDTIIITILPQLSSPTTSFPVAFDLTSIYSTITRAINNLGQFSKFTTVRSSAITRLGTLALCLQSDKEVGGICDLLLSIFPNAGDNTASYCDDTPLLGGILYAIGCIFSSRKNCANKARTIKHVGERLIQTTIPSENGELPYSKRAETIHLVNLLAGVDSEKAGAMKFQQLIEIISQSTSFMVETKLHKWRRRPLPLEDQCTGLLFGLALLHMATIAPNFTTPEFQCTLEFLSSFLECYPRASSRVLPSILDTVRRSIDESSNMPQNLSYCVKFIASKPIVSDPHGAHLAWAYLSPLTNDGIPAATRASIICILPQMCLNNRKLFRRCRDVVGKSIVSTDPIVRIAATATLSDMAKLDILRDVEGIVSWLQAGLNDEESSVTYFALTALRYLVENEELDFDLVVRVLEKKLAIDNIVDDLSGWNTLTLESLIELLGEGGLEEEDDESEQEEEEECGPAPTLKTTKAVSLLIELALKLDSVETFDYTTQTKLLSNIFKSLSKYTVLILGLEAEIVRSCIDSTSIQEEFCDDWNRYVELKTVAERGLNRLARLQMMQDDDTDSLLEGFSNNLISLLQLILSFEEDTFGSFIFRKDSSSTKSKNEGARQSRVSRSVLSALPATSSIKSIFESDENASSRVSAYFYTLGIENDNEPNPQPSTILGEMTECISYFAPPRNDFISFGVQICSIVNAMNAVFISIQNASEGSQMDLFDSAIEQLEEWATEISEYGYVALSALALSADDSPQFYSGISRIQNTIIDGSDMFETEDVKLLCYCIVAARLSRTADARTVDLIDSIEKSLDNHSYQSCLGGFLGLSMLVQSVSAKIKGQESDSSESWSRDQACRCICILLRSLNDCIMTQDGSILDLASCVEEGNSSAKLSLPSDLKLRDGMLQKLGAVTIALSHCFPALASIDREILNSVVAIFEGLPWGSGKGLTTHTRLKTLIDVGVKSPDDLSEHISDTMTHLQHIDNDSMEMLDALFSLASLCRLSSEKVKDELDFVQETISKILNSSRASIKNKNMALFTSCAFVGELPGVTSFVPNIHSSVRKDQVSNTVDMLNQTLSSGEAECTHTSALILGILCAMKNSSQTTQQLKRERKRDSNNPDVISVMQGKAGTVMEIVLKQLTTTHSAITGRSDKDVVSKQLRTLFGALESISLPSNFSKVFEVALNSSALSDTELKLSSLKILFSQIESDKRRIGFDGRGFIDLCLRLTKLPVNELCRLIGSAGAQKMMSAIPDLLFQLPTSTGEEVAKSLWGICRHLQQHPMVMTEFFTAMKVIFDSAGKESKDKMKLSTSPALLRALQNFVANGLFDEYCDVISHSLNNSDASTSYAITTATYLECLHLIATSAITTDTMGIQSKLSYDNILIIASCASFSSKQTRRVETWIARQNINEGSTNRRMLLLSSLAVAPQSRNDIEMKESIVNLFDIMLVTGTTDTLSVELIAVKVAYWWDSRNMKNTSAISHPIHRVSSMSSFLVSSDLSFEVQALSDNEIVDIFDLFLMDLPSKLALLCQRWGIAEDISNRATRLYKDAMDSKKKECLQKIKKLLDGGGQ